MNRTRSVLECGQSSAAFPSCLPISIRLEIVIYTHSMRPNQCDTVVREASWSAASPLPLSSLVTNYHPARNRHIHSLDAPESVRHRSEERRVGKECRSR